jgi:uncharacterized protein YbjT (DUF2867 family)
MGVFVLVTGATGRQGGATARALLDAGVEVHALVRDPGSERARSVAALGATLVPGDLDDPASLKAALDGARGVFSVQMPDFADADAEARYARHLAAAASATGVGQIVHTSVSGAGEHGGVDGDRWGAHMAHYWRSKAAAERAVRESGVPRWTVLRPSTFMENFVRPSFYYADFFGPASPDQLLLGGNLDVPQPFIAVADIGAAAAAAFADPERFDRVSLELAGDVMSFREAVRTLAAAWDTPLRFFDGPPEADATGIRALFASSQEFSSAHPAPARPEAARALGLAPVTLREWAERRT